MVPGAIIRATGPLRPSGHIEAQFIAILNMVAHIE
jgi:hypothetical protein